MSIVRLTNQGGLMWRKRAERQSAAPVNPAVVPIMDVTALRNEIKEGVGGPSLAMLVYTDEAFEIVSGHWNVIVEQDGYISYWVADRLVAMMGSSGEPEPVPSLRSLRINYRYPLRDLTTDVLPEYRRAS